MYLVRKLISVIRCNNHLLYSRNLVYYNIGNKIGEFNISNSLKFIVLHIILDAQ